MTTKVLIINPWDESVDKKDGNYDIVIIPEPGESLWGQVSEIIAMRQKQAEKFEFTVCGYVGSKTIESLHELTEHGAVTWRLPSTTNVRESLLKTKIFAMKGLADNTYTVLPKTAIRKYNIIEGEIGAGKSTLLAALAEELSQMGLNVAVVHEPVDIWRSLGMLDEFYENPKETAYDFQTLTFVTRIMATIEALEKDPNADVFLLERSVLTDRHVFMEIQKTIVKPNRMKMYELWFDLHVRLMPFKLSEANYIYIKPDISECMKRVGKRARAEEIKTDAVECKETAAKGGVDANYENLLRRAHDALFEGKSNEQFVEPSPRPFPLTAVTVIGPEIANLDFTEGGKQRASAAREIIGRAILVADG